MLEVQKEKPEANETNAAADSRVTRASSELQSVNENVERRTSDLGLVCNDLRKSFHSPSGERIDVLRGVSFSVQRGEAVAITGASGAGKSTLLHLLGGLDEPDHGSIIFGQFTVHKASRTTLAEFRNQQLGFVFQFHHLLPDLTAAENVSLPLMIRRVPRLQALRRAKEILEATGLSDRSSHLVGHLSGGEQQRVAVCRALVTRPSLILADEPTGNLDEAIGDLIAESLTKYAKECGAMVVVATHNQRMARLCDRTLLLANGRISI
jgi:lipoprotein-releasing system ATP-binding protein